MQITLTAGHARAAGIGAALLATIYGVAYTFGLHHSAPVQKPAPQSVAQPTNSPSPVKQQASAPAPRTVVNVDPAGHVIIDWPGVEILAKDPDGKNVNVAIARALLAVKNSTWTPMQVPAASAPSQPVPPSAPPTPTPQASSPNPMPPQAPVTPPAGG